MRAVKEKGISEEGKREVGEGRAREVKGQRDLERTADGSRSAK